MVRVCKFTDYVGRITKIEWREVKTGTTPLCQVEEIVIELSVTNWDVASPFEFVLKKVNYKGLQNYFLPKSVNLLG